MADLTELLARSDTFDWTVLSELDANEEFPTEACALLDEFGLPDYYVPEADGGRLVDFAELIRLLATVAAHDITVAVAHGKTFLGGASIWFAGTRRQRGSGRQPDQSRRRGRLGADGARARQRPARRGADGDPYR